MSKELVARLGAPMPKDAGPDTEVVLPAWALDLMIEAANRIRELELVLAIGKRAIDDVSTLEWNSNCSCDICRRIGHHLDTASKVAKAAEEGGAGNEGPLWKSFEPLMLRLLALPEQTHGRRACLQEAGRLRRLLAGSAEPGDVVPDLAAAARPDCLARAFGPLEAMLADLDPGQQKDAAIHELRWLCHALTKTAPVQPAVEPEGAP
ncbi:hypothetical protein LAZ40_09785 [Cereibacter sphaeroides]|uniref:hypothetical protein n=1 Tax=Cereibacter sphaeroides TaxID=1063 RepID=UPI001F1B8F67|nr:hypothetical protein [Cereibacter sphaeroides]MCE6959341.1 hypothetical protein [Cereibacter sphaeroides]MCE6972933.1 hypothetical protein [Cereibacter sphaeroides]